MCGHCLEYQQFFVTPSYHSEHRFVKVSAWTIRRTSFENSTCAILVTCRLKLCNAHVSIKSLHIVVIIYLMLIMYIVLINYLCLCLYVNNKKWENAIFCYTGVRKSMLVLWYRGKITIFGDTAGKCSSSGIQRKITNFGDAEGKWSYSVIQRENYHLLGYSGKMIIFWNTEGKWSSSGIQRENYHLLKYWRKMIIFWDTEGKLSNSGIQMKNDHLLVYLGQMIIFWNAEGQRSSSGIQKENDHILGYRGEMIIFWDTLRKNWMTYIVPAVFCLWVVFNEPVRHGPKQSSFNHYLQHLYCTIYCKMRHVALLFCIHIIKTSQEIYCELNLSE